VKEELTKNSAKLKLLYALKNSKEEQARKEQELN
jgi:hypothetical protein